MNIKQIEAFFTQDLWLLQTKGMPRWKRLCVETLKVACLAIRFFTTKRVMTQAAALTYSTLLAIVPIVAVVFAIARGFGYSKYIELWFRDALASQPQAADVIIGFVNSYLVHTKSGIFLGVGLLFMLYTVMMLVSNIEQTFNQIWQAKHQRSIFRTFTDYLAMFFVFPIIIVLSSGLTIFLATMASTLPDFLLLGPIVRELIDLSPYALMSLMFIALYIFMPNTHVRVKSVIVPGILAGIAMQWLQYFYIHSQIWMTGYNAIYGSFAALPLFMLWIQISWTICLFGAQLAYISQNLDYYDYDLTTEDISNRQQIMLSAMLMSRICKRFQQGGKPYCTEDLQQSTGIPIRIVNDLLYKLVEANMLIEISNDEKGEASRFVPAETLENLTLGTLAERLQTQGKWKQQLPLDRLFSPRWAKAEEIQKSYLADLSQISLTELSAK